MGLFKRVATPACRKQHPKHHLCGKCPECKKYKAAVWWASYTDNGEQQRESTKTADRAEAEEFLADKRRAARNGLSIDKEKANLTMEGLCKLWLKHATAVGKRSFDADRYRAQAIVEFFGANRRLIALVPTDIEAFRAHLEKTTTRLGRPMSPATVNRHLALLRSAIAHAGRDGYVHRDPARGIRMLPEHNTRERICSPDEYQRLIGSADPRLRLAIVFGYHTGMRMGEITGLRWADIDFCDRTISVRSQTTKTGEGRQLPLPDEVAAMLRDWPARPLDASTPIFSGEKYKRRKPSATGNDVEKKAERYVGIIGSNTLSPAFGRLCRKLGIEGLHFHDLRHSYATGLRRGDVDLFTASKMMGHKTLIMSRRYNTITVEDMRDAMAKVTRVKS